MTSLDRNPVSTADLVAAYDAAQRDYYAHITESLVECLNTQTAYHAAGLDSEYTDPRPDQPTREEELSTAYDELAAVFHEVMTLIAEAHADISRGLLHLATPLDAPAWRAFATARARLTKALSTQDDRTGAPIATCPDCGGSGYECNGPYEEPTPCPCRTLPAPTRPADWLDEIPF